MEFLREWFGNMEIWWPAGNHSCFFTGPAYYQLEPWAVDVISSAITSAGLILGWKVGYYLLVGRTKAREEREEKARKEIEALPITQAAQNILELLTNPATWILNHNGYIELICGYGYTLSLNTESDSVLFNGEWIQSWLNTKERRLILEKAREVKSSLVDKTNRENDRRKVLAFDKLKNLGRTPT